MHHPSILKAWPIAEINRIRKSDPQPKHARVACQTMAAKFQSVGIFIPETIVRSRPRPPACTSTYIVLPFRFAYANTTAGIDCATNCLFLGFQIVKLSWKLGAKHMVNLIKKSNRIKFEALDN